MNFTHHIVSRRARIAALVAVVALAASGCSSDKAIGSQDAFDFEETIPATETPTAKPKKPAETKKAEPKDTTKPAPKETRRKAPDFVLTIKGGQCGLGLCPYDPTQFQVVQGTKVIVKNTDSQPRSWIADNGEFDSGDIAPGKSYSYVVNLAPGYYPFHDGAASYITGQMIVVASQ